jgi:hypothetical protein
MFYGYAKTKDMEISNPIFHILFFITGIFRKPFPNIIHKKEGHHC